MSSAFQATQRADSFIGLGKRPDFTPSHQHVLPSGITIKTCVNRTKPVSGIISCPIKVPIEKIKPKNHCSASTPFLSVTLMSMASITGASAPVGFCHFAGSYCWMKSQLLFSIAKISFCKFFPRTRTISTV